MEARWIDRTRLTSDRLSPDARPNTRLQLTNADAVGSEVRPLALFICDET